MRETKRLYALANTPHPARKRLKLEYDDVIKWNPRPVYADLTGFGERGPDADLPGFDITAYWARIQTDRLR